MERIADRPVGGGEHQRVHRPGGGDAEAEVAVPSPVLKGDARPAASIASTLT